MKFYHMTSKKNLYSILKHGIIAQYSDSAFVRHKDSTRKLAYELRGFSHEAVFLTTNWRYALEQMGSFIDRNELRVLEISIEDYSKLSKDNCFSFEIVHNGNIKPNQIIDIVGV